MKREGREIKKGQGEGEEDGEEDGESGEERGNVTLCHIIQLK